MGKGVPVENMKELISLSRKYGADPDYVLAGGGNTSWKSDDLIVVKASGNGLTCSKRGEERALELFPDKCIWIPLVDPGYVLAKKVDDELSVWTEAHDGKLPDYIFLANHGVFLWGKDSQEIEDKSDYLFSVLNKASANTGAVKFDTKESVSADFLQKIGKLAGPKGDALFTTGDEIRSVLGSREDLHNLQQSLSPDHIVYMGHTPLVYDNLTEEEILRSIEKDYGDFSRKWGKEPKSILIQGKGFISMGNGSKGAETARLLMLDAIRVIRIADSFGGPEFMSEEKVNFINTWEVEKYRAKLSDKG